jgi:hypothetical protein
MEEAQQRYIGERLTPTLTAGLVALCRARPAEPHAWLAKWLLQHKPTPPIGPAVRSQSDTLAALTPALLSDGVPYRKVGRVFLRKARPGETVQTVLHGVVETTNTAPDDGKVYWVSHADTMEQERLILTDAKRRRLYALTPAPGMNASIAAELAAEGFGGPFEPLGRVLALRASHALLSAHIPARKFVAAWGAEMIVDEGDMLVSPMPSTGRDAAFQASILSEVYRIEKSVFEQTYTMLHSDSHERKSLQPIV